MQVAAWAFFSEITVQEAGQQVSGRVDVWSDAEWSTDLWNMAAKKTNADRQLPVWLSFAENSSHLNTQLQWIVYNKISANERGESYTWINEIVLIQNDSD